MLGSATERRAIIGIVSSVSDTVSRAASANLADSVKDMALGANECDVPLSRSSWEAICAQSRPINRLRLTVRQALELSRTVTSNGSMTEASIGDGHWSYLAEWARVSVIGCRTIIDAKELGFLAHPGSRKCEGCRPLRGYGGKKRGSSGAVLCPAS